MAKALVAVALLALLACALAQNQNADDARELGEPGNNYCKALCEEAVKRNKDLAKLEKFCKEECAKCVDAVSKTKKGAKEPLPGPCKSAYNFKEIPAIVGDFKSGKISGATKGGI